MEYRDKSILHTVHSPGNRTNGESLILSVG